MSIYANSATDDIVKIDANHALFTQSLVMCKKPRQVLEFGFGAGEATRAILAGLRYNRAPFEFTVVDNWLDFGGERPPATFGEEYEKAEFVTKSELDFLLECKKKYDFIFSDADHYNTQNWFDHVYSNLLARGGVLIYHDVTNCQMFPNLLTIYSDVVKNNYHHVLLNTNSAPGERCDRGLLAIFKH